MLYFVLCCVMFCCVSVVLQQSVLLRLIKLQCYVFCFFFVSLLFVFAL